MASLLLARGLNSLIASRDSISNENVAWNTITRRDSENQQVVWPFVMGLVWFITNVIIFLPVLLFLFYTINTLYPALAILEATDSSPEYELIVTNENDAEADGKIKSGSNFNSMSIEPNLSLDESSSSSTPMADEMGGISAIRSQPVTSGVLSTLLLLRSTGGGLFKAFKWKSLVICVYVIIYAAFSFIPHFPGAITSIIASLAATKAETVWTHAAVSKERNISPWRNSPSYISILKITVVPLVIQAVLVEVTSIVAVLPLGPIIERRNGAPIHAHMDSFTSVSSAVALAFTLYTCIMLPTEVILTRIRATTLPEETSIIVVLDPFIRSHMAEEMGLMSWIYAWRTFSRASWLRLARIWAKIFAATIVVQIFVVGLFFAQSLIFFAVMAS